MKKLLNSLWPLRKTCYSSSVPNDSCSEFEVDKWLLSQFVVERLVPIAGTRPFPLDELLLMAGTVVKYKPTHIFEWGTNIGKSARVFFETDKAFSLTTEIHSIDLPDTIEHVEHPQHQRGRMVRGLKGVFLHQGDGLETSLQLYNNFRERGCRPLFFVDGDHSYESVKRELCGILSTVPEAPVLVHDTFYQSKESGYNIGPYQAIEDTLAVQPHKYKKIAVGLGLPGMTLLYKR